MSNCEIFCHVFSMGLILPLRGEKKKSFLQSEKSLTAHLVQKAFPLGLYVEIFGDN